VTRGKNRTSRRNVLKTAAAVFAAPTILTCARRPKDAPPNIVLILADDYGIDSMPCYGSDRFETPRLDRMAAEGLRFANCYATPLCTPSRVEILSGLYPFRLGWRENIHHRVDDPERTDLPSALDPTTKTFATDLRAAGYATCVTGKWQLCYFDEHPDHCRELGFDEYCCWLWQVLDRETNAWRLTSRYWLPSIYRNGERLRDLAGEYGPDLHADYLLDFITRKKDTPFLAFASLALPHEPFQDTPDQIDPAQVTSDPTTDTACYKRMVAYMDKQVGRILDTLVELGIERNTLVLFTSDNGTPPEIPVRYRGVSRNGEKGRLTEGGTRVPLLAHWPGTIEPGRGSTQLVDLTDVRTTLAALTNHRGPFERKLDGVSFAPVLRGGRESVRQVAYSMLRDERFARGSQYKVYSDGRFFDVLADPHESNDLQHDAATRAARLELKTALAGLGA
jgi:arylsulfatase A